MLNNMDAELKSFEKELESLLARVKDEFHGIRTNRPTAKLVEDIKANYFDQEMPIKSLGGISIAPPRDIVISIWDKGAVNAVAKAIENANIGMTPNIDGNNIRLTLPALTDERKADLIKVVKKTTEEHRIRIRQMRDEINKKIKKAEDEDEISENESFKLKERVQKAVDKINVEIEKLLEGKVKEIEE